MKVIKNTDEILDIFNNYEIGKKILKEIDKVTGVISVCLINQYGQKSVIIKNFDEIFYVIFDDIEEFKLFSEQNPELELKDTNWENRIKLLD